MSRNNLPPKIKADHHERRLAYLKVVAERKSLSDNQKHFENADDLAEIATRLSELDTEIDAYWAWVTENIPAP